MTLSGSAAGKGSSAGKGTARLRLAMAVLAVAAAGLTAGQKQLLTRPGPGLLLLVAAAGPFVVAAAWPRLIPEGRPPGDPDRARPGGGWRLAAATLVSAVAATALLGVRPGAGDAAVAFFIALAAWLAAATGPRVSVPAGLLLVAVPQAAGHLGGSHATVMAALGTAFAWIAGSAVRAQGRTAAELVAAQAAAARHQVAAERQQLAREFHDLVGHTLSVTMLHLAAVQVALEDGEPGEAAESLDLARRAGREAMREMRQAVAVLGTPEPDGTLADPAAPHPAGRDAAGQAAPAPALPHVRDLPELVAGCAAAGLRVSLDAGDGLAEVPGDTGLAAYRIAQESLTNAARHAPGSAAHVRVRVTATELRLTITNDAVPATAPESRLGPASATVPEGGPALTSEAVPASAPGAAHGPAPVARALPAAATSVPAPGLGSAPAAVIALASGAVCAPASRAARGPAQVAPAPALPAPAPPAVAPQASATVSASAPGAAPGSAPVPELPAVPPSAPSPPAAAPGAAVPVAAVPGAVAAGGGNGVAGMSQRARLAGGTLTAGLAGGQWRVEAALPVGDRP